MNDTIDQDGTDDLVRFVPTKGTRVAGRFKDKTERIAETVSDLELALEGGVLPNTANCPA